MTAAYLAQLDRPELDELIRTAEHAEAKARIAFHAVPLHYAISPLRLGMACGVLQECMDLVGDAYEASWLLLAAEMDRVFDLAGDPPEYQPDEDSE